MEWYHNSQNPVATLTVVSELQWRIFQVVLASKRKSVALVPDLGKFLFGKMGGYQCGTTHLPVWLVRYFEYHLDTIFFYKFNGTVSFLLLCLFPPKTNPPGKHRNPYVPFSLRGATGTIWVLGVVQFFSGVKIHLKQRRRQADLDQNRGLSCVFALVDLTSESDHFAAWPNPCFTMPEVGALETLRGLLFHLEPSVGSWDSKDSWVFFFGEMVLKK